MTKLIYLTKTKFDGRASLRLNLCVDIFSYHLLEFFLFTRIIKHCCSVIDVGSEVYVVERSLIYDAACLLLWILESFFILHFLTPNFFAF